MTLATGGPTGLEHSALGASPARLEPVRDGRDPARRLRLLLDAEPSELPVAQDTAVTAVHGLIDGAPVVAYCMDARRMGGSLGVAEADVICAAIRCALEREVPVIGLWHSGGAKLADGVESMDGVGRMFATMTAASGRIPQISVVVGPAAGAAAYGPALTDLVVMSESGKAFVTGPDVVRSVTGEHVDMDSLGGADVHGRRSGVAHVIAPSEEEALARARAITTLLARPDRPGLSTSDAGDLGDLIPTSPRRVYDVRPVLGELLDGPLEELHENWAPNVTVGLGRLCGRTVGVVANNPLRKGGCLDSPSAEKAARFVRMCDGLGVPLFVVVDVPGYLPGAQHEWDGVVRRGAKLLYAFAEAVVPRVTLITRKSFGGAYIAMNSRALGATRVFAWPGAEVAVMGAEAAVGVLHRKRLAAVADDERELLHNQLVQQRDATGLDRASPSESSTRSCLPRRPGAGWRRHCSRLRRSAVVTATYPCDVADKSHEPSSSVAENRSTRL